jgi:hypothetical protein
MDTRLWMSVMSVFGRSVGFKAVAIFLSIAISLKASWGQSDLENTKDAENTKNAKELATNVQLPDVKSLMERQQLLHDVNNYLLCKKELTEITDLQSLPAQITDPKWLQLESQASKFGIVAAFYDTKELFLKNRSLLRKKDSFAIAIYSKTQRQKRKIFVADLVKVQISSFDIEHARGSFENAGHNRSSVGCFVGGVNVKDSAFNLQGFDGTLNSCACERRLQVHISESRGTSHLPSFGCLTLKNVESYNAIAAAVSGGGLICAYDEGRVPERK